LETGIDLKACEPAVQTDLGDLKNQDNETPSVGFGPPRLARTDLDRRFKFTNDAYIGPEHKLSPRIETGHPGFGLGPQLST
jgi:hypothetical protein